MKTRPVGRAGRRHGVGSPPRLGSTPDVDFNLDDLGNIATDDRGGCFFGGAIIGAAVERAVLSDHVGADGFALESTTVPTFAV